MSSKIIPTIPEPPIPEKFKGRGKGKTKGKSDGKAADAPDVADKPTEEPSKAKETKTKETKAKTEAQQAKAEEQGAQVKKDQLQGRLQKTQQQDSTFLRDTSHRRGAEIPERMGLKINIQQQPQKQPTQEQKPLDKNLVRDGKQLSQKSLQRALQRPLPQRPSHQAYRAVAQGKNFQGPLKGSPLHQKLLQQSLKQQIARQAMGQDPSKPLTKGEILQMFRMRHQADQKDRFRDIMKYELAKARQLEAKKVQSVKYQTDSHQKQQGTRKAQQTQMNKMDTAKRQLAQRLQKSSTPSKFESVLQKVLAGNKSVPSLAEGVRARFAAKSDAQWNTFFQNVLNQNSTQTKAQAQLTQLIEALFRGLHNKGGENNDDCRPGLNSQR